MKNAMLTFGRTRLSPLQGKGVENLTARIDRALGPAYISAMALRDILKIPDKRLRLVSERVKRVDASVRALADDMFETMYAAPGIGLAAIQIGIPTRLVVMDLSKKDEAQAPQVFINPEITWRSEETGTHEEGCLSIPDYYEEVERPQRIKVNYLDLDGKRHEIDHTNGVLFIDHISKLKRDRVIKKFTKALKLGKRPSFDRDDD